MNGRYHLRFEDAIGSSYPYWIGDDDDSNLFHDYFDRYPGAIDLWLGGHTDAYPDDSYGGKSLVERRWNITFAIVAALTRYHHSLRDKNLITPMSRLLMFTRGSNEVLIQCYLHTSNYAPEGWYVPAERRAILRHPFAG